MTVSLKHTFQSAKTDSADVTIVQPSNWNQEHDLTLATNKVLGRATAGTGAAEELSVGTALSISGGTLAVTNVPVANGGTGAATLTGYVKGSGTSAFTASATIPTSDLTGTLGVANGGTGAATLTANNVLIGNGTSAVTSVAPGTLGNVLTSNGTSWTSTAISSGVAFPQNIQSADYTLVIGDAGKQIFHPVADTTPRRYTIPSNASVAFPIGTVVLFTVENGGNFVSVGINSDTLVFGAGTTGSLLVAANNTLMAIKVTSTKWMANYLYQTGNAAGNESIAVAHQTTPFVSAYPWTVSGGFGTKYSNPTTLPVANARGVAFNPAGTSIAVAHFTSPFVSAYPWNVSTGFGTKYTDPATLPTGDGTGVTFNPAGTSIAVTHEISPYVTAYPWNVSTGFGTKYTNPATLPTGIGRGVAFNPSGTVIAVTHDTAPFITTYPWNAGTGFGTKYTDPATGLGAGRNGTGVAFSPAGDALAISHDVTPYISAYAWSGAGFGTKFANPATLPTGTGQGVAFSPAGTAIAVAHDTTPFVTAYPWSGTAFGTKYTNPVTLPSFNGKGVAFGVF